MAIAIIAATPKMTVRTSSGGRSGMALAAAFPAASEIGIPIAKPAETEPDYAYGNAKVHKANEWLLQKNLRTTFTQSRCTACTTTSPASTKPSGLHPRCLLGSRQ